MKRVEVEWRDSMSLNRWQGKENALHETRRTDYLDCRSVGYLLEDSKDRITLVQNTTSDEDSVSDVMTIPRESVTKITPLRTSKGK